MTLRYRSLTIFLIIIAVAGCSDTDPANEGSNVIPKSVASLITTQSNSSVREGWACVDQVGEPSVYTFHGVGTVDGFEQVSLGAEYSIRANVPPFNFAWSVIDNASIVLQSPPLGLQDQWSNIEFSDDGSTERLMRANSDSKGQLLCSLEGAAV